MSNKVTVFGDYLYFVRAGTTVDGVTVSETAKPDADPTTNWPQVANATKVTIENNSTYYRQKRPALGKTVFGKKIVKERDIKITAEFDEVGTAMHETAMMLPGPTTANTAVRPLDGEGTLLGWWKLQRYNSSDTLETALDIYGYGTFKTMGGELGNEVKVTLEIEPVYTALNSAIVNG